MIDKVNLCVHNPSIRDGSPLQTVLLCQRKKNLTGPNVIDAWELMLSLNLFRIHRAIEYIYIEF